MRRAVLLSPGEAADEASCNILDKPQKSDGGGREATEKGAAEVQTGNDQSLDKELGLAGGEEWEDSPDAVL